VVEIEEFTAVLKLTRVETNASLTQFSLSLQPYYITIITVFSNNQATLLSSFSNSIIERKYLKMLLTLKVAIHCTMTCSIKTISHCLNASYGKECEKC
jgi:hypothetical protein